MYVILSGTIPSLVSIDLVRGDGRITGTITAGHLDRLGNANWAEPGTSNLWTAKTFEG